MAIALLHFFFVSFFLSPFFVFFFPFSFLSFFHSVISSHLHYFIPLPLHISLGKDKTGMLE
ncbi:hypothetical protein L228DRAFT_79414 [Xylona heveae TC161]|uniref:Uncharacterized protein n=1 Tax=Xylona heveae (strain CBS 132557 / TC161) TaxID=1328760 RepID=A0A165IZK1_XYLHT|nr:hypothetical protein L228DRAFT_79414 [Xylona heveae TC161]KZF25590.1 hypothetical protein L228DRAFT_79414 [Xylona heveae TC161]